MVLEDSLVARLAEPLRHLRKAPLGEPLMLVGLSLAVGFVGGLGAILFRLMISWVQGFFRIFFGAHASGLIGHWSPMVTPAIGLLAVSMITRYAAREVKGHGVPQILESIALRGGRIRPRVGIFGILAPAITIGSGGSVGREGPIALIGAAFGSSLGQVMRLSEKYVSLLVACGAAAGIGATFNAPIAGGLFGLEVVLGSYAMGALVPVFLASVVGTSVFTLIMGNKASLPTPPVYFQHPTGILLMMVLGLLAGALGLAYTRGLNFAEDLFDGWRVPFWVPAVVGGLGVGILGVLWPEVRGVGYGTMHVAAAGQLAAGMFLILLVAKFVATLGTVGAGGSGGVFAPSLYLGLMLSGAFGSLVHQLFPASTSPAAVYGIAGMGAVFAAAAQAPLTAMVIILEMTGDYHLTMGVIAACAISYLFYGSLARDSMYTVKLARRGIQILRGSEVRPLQRVQISEALVPLPARLHLDDTVEEAYRLMTDREVSTLLVFDDDEQLVGVVDERTVFQAIGARQHLEPVSTILSEHVRTISADSTLDDAMRRFGIYQVDMLPVRAARGNEIVGVVTRQAVLRTYYTQTVLSLETSAKIELLSSTAPEDGGFREVMVEPGSAWDGHSVKELAPTLPKELVLVSLRRLEKVIVPHGDTLVQAHDRLLFYGAPVQALDLVEAYVRPGVRPRLTDSRGPTQ